MLIFSYNPYNSTEFDTIIRPFYRERWRIRELKAFVQGHFLGFYWRLHCHKQPKRTLELRAQSQERHSGSIQIYEELRLRCSGIFYPVGPGTWMDHCIDPMAHSSTLFWSCPRWSWGFCPLMTPTHAHWHPLKSWPCRGVQRWAKDRPHLRSSQPGDEHQPEFTGLSLMPATWHPSAKVPSKPCGMAVFAPFAATDAQGLTAAIPRRRPSVSRFTSSKGDSGGRAT